MEAFSPPTRYRVAHYANGSGGSGAPHPSTAWFESHCLGAAGRIAALSGKADPLLVPSAPGGPADIAARLVGAKLTEAWGQQVVVENRPGGNGFIAMTAAAKSAPDGYTLVMATIGEAAVSPVLFKEVPSISSAISRRSP